MSYILDALKKSEQERGHGSIPSVQTVHSSSLNYGNKKTYWPYILIAAVFLNLAAILYFVFDKDKPAENIAAIETATAVSNTGLSASADKMQTAITATPYKQPAGTTSIPHVTPADKVNSAPATSRPLTGNQVTVIPDTDSKSMNNASQYNAQAERNTSVDNTEVIEFDELPASIKQQLPAIIISAHVYSSNPLQRSIVINNNFMEEGEYFLDGMVLQEITADGAIFHYKDIKFHLGVVSGWQ